MSSSEIQFPPGFLWGAATAAYQVEGAAAEDGRTPSIWDTFARVPGAVIGGNHGDVACDHYHRYAADVALMKELNLRAYRFSVAWPRVRPDAGPVNPAGLAFYDRLVDELLGNDIVPWLTLYHWDLPQALEDRGGWTDRDTAHRFVEYSLSVHDALGDRVAAWTTLNEPWCSAFLGHTGGQHAPGRQEGANGLVAAHHLMLAHGMTVQELRRRGVGTDPERPEAGLGITLNFTVADPNDPADPVDVDAARRVDGLFNRVFLDPIFRGSYPADIVADTEGMPVPGRGSWTDVIQDGDLEVISSPIDVLGVNYYNGNAIAGRPHPDELKSNENETGRTTGTPYVGCDDVIFVSRGLPRTAMDWEVQPEGLTRLLVRLKDEYAVPPLYVTENGAAYDDQVFPDGSVHDPERVAFIDAHLRAAHDAMEQGVDLRGFFQWSLLDNYEWAFGYTKRFGIVHVDYDTQVRTPKTSARFYADVAATGRLGSSEA
ncbi:GH1 family beta-glucosidase [Nocardioides abyssi]|uniref:Beta-glucosidase n=1 Tax=Nocardioides abyssi TaxID=3058370 RepID=A0ABT8EWE3_9ACTN|nr:GH1 family beta-glucosidase [Nocardioides abyssi]MDN4162507.1 GH1 family beta-glucosidase [Nocardioides abyssi]